MHTFIDEALCKAKFQCSSRVLNIKYNDIDFVDGMACKTTKDLSYIAIYNSIIDTAYILIWISIL